MRLTEKNLTKREKEQDLSVVATCHAYKWYVNTGTTTLFSTFNQCGSVNKRSLIGFNVPDFHRRKRKGELMPHTPFEKFECYGNSTGVYDWYTTDGDRLYADHYPAFSSNWIITESELKALAPLHYDDYVGEAAARIYGQGYDALTALAELMDIKRFIHGIGKTFSLMIRRAPSNWKHLSSEWLSVRYGWRPLINDIKSLSEAIAKYRKHEKPITRYAQRCGGSITTTRFETSNVETAGFWVAITQTDTIKTSIRGSVVADIEVPQFQFNPLQTGWELIPFSFVIDWFVNIGKTLSAFSFLAREKAYSAASGYRIEVERVLEASRSTPKASYASGPGITQSATCTASLEVRTPCSIPLNPHFILKMDGLKVLDLISLILQRI